MGFRIPFTNSQLRNIATFGAVFVGGNVLLMHYLMHKRFHQSPYFVPAASAILSHKGLVDYLGEPVAFGNPDLGDKANNFSTESEAKFEVPLKGSKTKGLMKFEAVRMAPEPNPDPGDSIEKDGGNKAIPSQWNLTRLEVHVDDRPSEKIVLVRKAELADS